MNVKELCFLLFCENILFTTGDVNNIEHTSSSTTAQGAFHGTSISLFQNRLTESDGILRQKLEIQQDQLPKSRQIPPLPESYTMLTPVTAKKDPPIPPIQATMTCDSEILNTVLKNENRCLNNTHRLVGEAVHIIDDPIC